MSASLAVFGTAANIIGVVSFTKDVGEIVKAVADSLEQVRFRIVS